MRELYLICLIAFLTPIFLFAQEAAFSDFETSRFARAIGLGNAYTGVAEGIETVYYNSAGLARLNSYQAIYSNGNGFGFFDDVHTYDAAVVAPLPGKAGTVAFSHHYTGMSFSSDYFHSKDDQSIYMLHLAKAFGNSLSAGVSFNYYHSRHESTPVTVSDPPDGIITGNGFGINFSALYELPFHIFAGLNDRLRFGLQDQNLINTKVKYSIQDVKDFLPLMLRGGLSYRIIPLTNKEKNRQIVSLLFAFEAVLLGADNSFNYWQPNYGIELTLLEYLQLRFGRESEFEIDPVYSYSPQFPVNRFGFGVRLPVSELLHFGRQLALQFDYNYSDWNQIDESGVRFLDGETGINRSAFSIKLITDL